MNQLRVLDLFSGIGGFSLGLERAGMKTVAFCEIDPFCRRVLAKHWPKVPCYDDVRTLTAERLVADGISVDVICGGFPCQDISVAGRKAGMGTETRSGLWSEIVRLSQSLGPRFIIVENVAALLAGPSAQPGAWFGRVLSDLAILGFDAEWENIPAAAMGAPHMRERVWLIAYPRGQSGSLALWHQNNVAKSQNRHSAQWRQNRVFPEVASVRTEVLQRWMDRSKTSGMDDGVSDWSYRAKSCGNSVLPQIPELIGRAILDSLEAE